MDKEEQQLATEISRLKDELKIAHLENERLTDKLSASESELNKLSLAIEQTTESIIITDKHSIIEYVNPAFSVITGYSRQEVLGQKTSILKSEAQDEQFYKNMWETIDQGKAWSGTLIEKNKNGTFYPCIMSITPVYNRQKDVSHFVAIQKDMTKERELEEQFIQAQKMEAIGTLVGGVAHDFNNILAAMQGNVFLAKRKLDTPDYVLDKLENLGLLSVAAAAMVKQLLTFSRKDVVNMKSFSLNTFMKEGFKLTRTAIPENIAQLCNTCQEKLVIRGDATQLLQVLMNLVNNACHAVRDIAEPQISCELNYYHASDSFLLKYPELEVKDFARLSVSDNGSGINDMHLQKIFEPFYTTKSVGEGTGLGLSMVFGSVKRHGGIVEVETEVGKGTTFHIYLPLDEIKSQPVLRDDANILMGKGELILLVDDEQRVREVLSLSLVTMGYKVVEARNGQEALQLIEDMKLEVALVISDVIMPGMGGLELLKNIRLLSSNIPAIFISGYDQGESDYAAQTEENSLFMSKPFDYEPLSSNLRSLLD